MNLYHDISKHLKRSGMSATAFGREALNDCEVTIMGGGILRGDAGHIGMESPKNGRFGGLRLWRELMSHIHAFHTPTGLPAGCKPQKCVGESKLCRFGESKFGFAQKSGALAGDVGRVGRENMVRNLDSVGP